MENKPKVKNLKQGDAAYESKNNDSIRDEHFRILQERLDKAFSAGRIGFCMEITPMHTADGLTFRLVATCPTALDKHLVELAKDVVREMADGFIRFSKKVDQ